MTKYKYAFKTEDDKVVKTVGRDIAVSPKMAIEMCKYLNGMSVAKAKGILELVKEQKLAIPITRMTDGVGHKKTTPSAGRYPLKGSIQFLKLLKQLEVNAQNKNLGTDLVLIHACAQRAPEPYHMGRQRVQTKRCHVEMAAIEAKSHVKTSKKKEQPRADKRSS